ncbi:hypothetical protein KW786_02390 [Candidatus Parcubacteria bacterium]|nr:hypothetical protein [Candidatus Parcubacteria bacterium]
MDLVDYFRDGEVADALLAMQRDGAALVPWILRESVRAELGREISRLPFAQAVKAPGRVRQNFDYCAFLGTVPVYPQLEGLRLAIQQLIRSSGVMLRSEDAECWLANDTAVQCYQSRGGISGHLDPSRFVTIIAILTIEGGGTLEVLAARGGPVLKSLRLQPGDLALLRGAANHGEKTSQQRPFHWVSTLAGQSRTSVMFRYNVTPEKPLPGLVYANAPLSPPDI